MRIFLSRLFHIRQLFKVYQVDEKVSALLRQFAALSSLSELFSLRANNTRQGYARKRTLKPAGYFFMAIENCVGSKRQGFEQAVLSPAKVAPVVRQIHFDSLSPALIAEYQTQLPDKALLQAKLHEFYQLDTAARGGEV